MSCDVPGWLPDPEPFIAAGRQCPHCSARPIIEGGRVTLPHRETCTWRRHRDSPADVEIKRRLHFERRTREAHALNRRRGGAS